MRKGLAVILAITAAWSPALAQSEPGEGRGIASEAPGDRAIPQGRMMERRGPIGDAPRAEPAARSWPGQRDWSSPRVVQVPAQTPQAVPPQPQGDGRGPWRGGAGTPPRAADIPTMTQGVFGRRDDAHRGDWERRRDDAARQEHWRQQREIEARRRSGDPRWGDGRYNDPRQNGQWNNGQWNNGRWNNGQWNNGRWNRQPNYDPRGYGYGYGRGGYWSRDWRRDSRYDWQRYRYSNRSLFQLGRYYPPYGYDNGYSRVWVGLTLGRGYYEPNYWLNDPWQYRLPYTASHYRWVRYYDDVLLIDLRTGRVVDVIHDFFW